MLYEENTFIPYNSGLSSKKHESKKVMDSEIY
jgi:hypothetical protein